MLWTRKRAAAVVLAVGTAASLAALRQAQPHSTWTYSVAFAVSPNHNAERSEDALDACLDRRGAGVLTTRLSLPPQYVVAYEGSDSGRAALERCLQGLPSVHLQGPKPLATPLPR